MRRMRFTTAAFGLFLLPLALAGCGRGDDDPGPQGVSADEARALDEAARIIESRRPPPDLLQPSAVQASESPVDAAP